MRQLPRNVNVWTWLIGLCLLRTLTIHAKRGGRTTFVRRILTSPSSSSVWRAGAFESNTDPSSSSVANSTVQNYVAAMREKDHQDRQDETDHDETEEEHQSQQGEPSPSAETSEDDPAIVGVKSHASKKSNAVGDPDGDDDDDDDDENEDLSEFSEEWEELEDFDNMLVEPQVQVEVELVEEDEKDEASSSGGVGVRMGRMNSRRKNRAWKSKLSHDHTRLLKAWTPHIYFPPTPQALAYLDSNARIIDAMSKSRLDRRTLYAGLLLEWGTTATSKLANVSRKFLPSPTSQSLQAALSMATQPQWRLSSPRTNGIRLYQGEETGKTSTLGMQETIAMALVSSSSFFESS